MALFLLTNPMSLLPRILFLALIGLIVISAVEAGLKFSQALELGRQALVQERQGVDRDQAAEIAREATEGRVLDVQDDEWEGRPVYHVKVLLQDGRVRTVRVDAQSGDLLD